MPVPYQFGASVYISRVDTSDHYYYLFLCRDWLWQFADDHRSDFIDSADICHYVQLSKKIRELTNCDGDILTWVTTMIAGHPKRVLQFAINSEIFVFPASLVVGPEWAQTYLFFLWTRIPDQIHARENCDDSYCDADVSVPLSVSPPRWARLCTAKASKMQ